MKILTKESKKGLCNMGARIPLGLSLGKTGRWHLRDSPDAVPT
jgi:hypothetical protein